MSMIGISTVWPIGASARIQEEPLQFMVVLVVVKAATGDREDSRDFSKISKLHTFEMRSVKVGRGIYAI